MRQETVLLSCNAPNVQVSHKSSAAKNRLRTRRFFVTRADDGRERAFTVSGQVSSNEAKRLHDSLHDFFSYRQK
jgi:hypothetical protein